MSVIQRCRGTHIDVSSPLEKAKNVKWAVIDTGCRQLPLSEFFYPRGLIGQTSKVWTPFWCSFIETPDAKIMVDTGLNVERDRKLHAGTGWVPDETQEPEHTVAEQLGQIGVDPDDIDIVIYSHLHIDHASWARLFKKARHITQLAELHYAVKPDNFMEPFYNQADYIPLLKRFYPIEGDAMIVPGVYCFETPGHTPGHQVILVMPEKGQPWLLAHDAAGLRQNYEDEWPSYIVYDPAEYVLSVKRQKEIVKKLNAKHYPGHDIEVYKEMKKAPEWQYNDY